jgi:hypothetical protein
MAADMIVASATVGDSVKGQVHEWNHEPLPQTYKDVKAAEQVAKPATTSEAEYHSIKWFGDDKNAIDFLKAYAKQKPITSQASTVSVPLDPARRAAATRAGDIEAVSRGESPVGESEGGGRTAVESERPPALPF